MVKIYRLFLASPFDFSSAVSSYLTEAAIICQKKWRQIEGGTFCLSTPENKRGPDLGLTVGYSHRSQFMLSHMRQLSLLKKPSDVTGPCSLSPPPHEHPLCPVSSSDSSGSNRTLPGHHSRHEDQLSLACELHDRASLLHSPLESTFLDSQQEDKAALFLPNKRGDGVEAQTGGRCS